MPHPLARRDALVFSHLGFYVRDIERMTRFYKGPMGFFETDRGLLGTVQLAIPCLLVVRLSRELPATELALLALLEVIFGVLLAWLGANEIPSDSTLAGGALVLAALAANHLAGRR